LEGEGTPPSLLPAKMTKRMQKRRGEQIGAKRDKGEGNCFKSLSSLTFQRGGKRRGTMLEKILVSLQRRGEEEKGNRKSLLPHMICR